jgi:Icc-related predicted phosphoesterase
MTDFKSIRHWPSFKKFQPHHARQAHVNSQQALRNFLQSGERDRSIVITHHAPSARSLPEKFKADPLSGAYASNMDDFIEELGPKLWIHGHIHQPSSYTVGTTRVVANPCGYPGEEGFIPDHVIEL